MADIRFYDFNFNLVRILPPNGDEVGYKSIDTKQDYKDVGSLEIIFHDPELKSLVEEHKANLFVKWRGFCGFLTSYRWTDSECKITGMHLNGLLHRAVIKATKPLVKNKETEEMEFSDVTDNVANIAKSAVSKISWLSFKKPGFVTDSVTYGTEQPEKADTFFKGLFDASKYGYEITADFKNKMLYFELIMPSKNQQILSKNNNNAYAFETTYINKPVAYGGWYKKEENTWEYVTLDETILGINAIDTVLEAENEADAIAELKKCKADFEILATLQNLEYGKDYRIGDIIRVQYDGKMSQRFVSGVNRWEENGYNESPIMTEYEEEI